MTRISTIAFDLDDTLIDCSSALRRACAMLLDESVCPPSHELAAIIAVAPSCRALAKRLHELNLIASAPRDTAARLSALMLQNIRPDPAVNAMLAELGGPYQLVLASNGSSDRQRQKLARAQLGDAFAKIYVSGELGVRKPGPQFFREFLDTQTLMVGDSPNNDIDPAARLGARTFWVSRGRNYPRELALPDFRGDSVLQVQELDCLSRP